MSVQSIQIRSIEVEDFFHFLDALAPLLLGRVFHKTNQAGHEGITKRNAILNNHKDTFPVSFGQTHKSYGKHMAYVSLFDVRAKTVADIDNIHTHLED